MHCDFVNKITERRAVACTKKYIAVVQDMTKVRCSVGGVQGGDGTAPSIRFGLSCGDGQTDRG